MCGARCPQFRCLEIFKVIFTLERVKIISNSMATSDSTQTNMQLMLIVIYGMLANDRRA